MSSLHEMSNFSGFYLLAHLVLPFEMHQLNWGCLFACSLLSESQCPPKKFCKKKKGGGRVGGLGGGFEGGAQFFFC